MKLAEKLVYLRKEKGVSQLKLAEMMDVSRQAISRWETGVAVPSTENLKYLSNIYNVSLDYLFNDAADEPERKKGVIDKPEELAFVPDSVDNRKNGKRKIVKWVAIALGLLASIVAIYIFEIVGDKSDSVPINDIQRKEVETEVGPGFDLEW
jgi:transcriptional regulator with XRE-family HTH domain